MFSTTLNHEYAVAAELLGLDEAGVADLARAAVRASFLDDAGKAALLGRDRRVRDGVRSHRRPNLEPCPTRPRYRPAPGTIPLEPGVYKFRDERGRVIYVGKAKSLRQRLNSYFADVARCTRGPGRWSPRAASVEWTVVAHRGRGAAARVHLDQGVRPAVQRPLPRRQVLPVAGRHALRGVPAAAGDARRRSARACATSGPTPTPGRSARRSTCCCGCSRRAPAPPACSSGPARSAGPACSATSTSAARPCVGRVSADEHREIVDDFCDFMAGQTDLMIRRLEKPDGRGQRRARFERAARLRDDLEALRRAMEKQAVVLGDGTDADVVAFAEDDLEAAVQVFHVRGGRVRGQRGWVVDKARRRSTTGELVEQFLAQFYGGRGRGRGDARACRARSWCPAARRRRAWASGCRAARHRVSLRVPQRGDKRALLETVARNAAQALRPAQAQTRVRPHARSLAGRRAARN